MKYLSYSHLDQSQLAPLALQENQNTNSNVETENAGPDMPPRSLSHISEASKEPWAITQKFSSSHGPKSAVKILCYYVAQPLLIFI